MNKEKLILKWLDDDISDEEMKEIKQLPEFEDYLKISNKAHHFKPPEFNTYKVLDKIKSKHYRSRNLYWQYSIAASIILIFSALLVYNFDSYESINTSIAEQKEIILPDNSKVSLNAGSIITYDAENWNTNRTIQLEGEAFFKVAKGEKFDVTTNNATVSVLGTEFVVNNRSTFLEVMTFEGLVQVVTKDTILNVSKGNSIVINKDDFSNYTFEREQPTWLEGSSSFKSTQLEIVLNELERQYDITLNIPKNLQLHRLYTGNFPHNNLEEALQSISVPMNLKYSLKGEKTVSLAYIEEK